MIATFIYTECQSAGVFKSEPGFKIKDVNLWKVKDNRIFQDKITESNSSVVEQVIMEAVGGLPYYESPNMGPFIMQSEFLKLDRQWVYFSLQSGYRAFVRMSSTGLSNGRRGNPFHMGIVFDGAGISAMLAYWKKAANLKQVFTPADLFSWSGWQDPRTDQELEETSLSVTNFPTPTLLPKKRFVDDSDFISSHRAEIRTGLVELENSLSQQVTANLVAENTWDFMKVCSVISKFLPTGLIWATNLQSSFLSQDRSRGRGTGWGKAIVLDGNDHKNAGKATWAALAMNILEVEGYKDIEPLIQLAGSGIQWSSTSTSSGLWLLPTVLLLASAAPNDFISSEDVHDAYNVALKYWPQGEVQFKSEPFKDSLVQRARMVPYLDEQSKDNLVQSLAAIGTKS